ncbi:MAG: hypothetical protein WAZ19_08240 [Anaerolineae bacterium]|jgi:hypothetical protein
MTGQLALPMWRTADPDTSRDAAILALETTATLRQRCLTALVAAGADGLTDFELAEIVGRQPTSAGKRRGELVALGLVEATDRRRPTPSGATAIVWVATEATD